MSNGIYIDVTNGANGIASFLFGKNYRVTNVTSPELDYDVDDDDDDDNDYDLSMKTTPSARLTEIVSYVPLFRLRYSLDVSTSSMEQMSKQWERAALRSLNENFRSNSIELSVSTSTAVTDLVSRQARDDAIYLALLFVIFFILVCICLTCQGNRHTSVGHLSLCGLMNFFLSSGATFGLLTLMKIVLIEPMALLVFVLASKTSIDNEHVRVHRLTNLLAMISFS
jgi:hypothetical protein